MGSMTRPEPLFPDVAGYAGYLARKGAALLDQHGPEGWRQMINLRGLDLASPYDCILGQLYRGDGEAPFYLGKLRLWHALGEPEEMNGTELAMCSGFLSGYLPILLGSDDHPNWLISNLALRDAWIAILTPAS